MNKSFLCIDYANSVIPCRCVDLKYISSIVGVGIESLRVRTIV